MDAQLAVLRTQLGSPNRNEREGAIAAFPAYGKGALWYLVPASRDRDPVVSQAAFESLGKMGQEGFQSILQERNCWNFEYVAVPESNWLEASNWTFGRSR